MPRIREAAARAFVRRDQDGRNLFKSLSTAELSAREGDPMIKIARLHCVAALTLSEAEDLAMVLLAAVAVARGMHLP